MKIFNTGYWNENNSNGGQPNILQRGEYCGPHCHCGNCKNNCENESIRAETISNILEKNPDAFRAKITINSKNNNINT